MTGTAEHGPAPAAARQPPAAATATAAGPSASPAPPAASATGYGGFTLGAMDLALPMAVLREVVPCTGLLALPCPAAAVVGGLALRGVVLPVVDLRRLLGADASRPCPVVVILVHQGRVLGLLADGVSGVFTADARGLHRTQAADGLAAILAGSVCRADDGRLVNVLSADALAALPQVPMVDDPEPQRQRLADDAAALTLVDDALPMMLVRCHRVGLALDAMAVYATVSEPRIQPGVLSGIGCLGTIDFAGARVPAIDLMAVCGLGVAGAVPASQAFVLKLADGMVALMIGEVLDVVRTRPGDVVPVPAFALPRPALFAGALPAERLGDEVVLAARTLGPQFLVLDGAALRSLPELVALSQTNTRGEGTAAVAASGFAVAAEGQGLQRAMITYDLGGEAATPIDQVCEILPYQPEAAVFDHAGPLLGMVINRGRSIPVMCLSGLSGLPAPAATQAVSVLVVESEGEMVGFAVPQLRSIEPADWEPRLPTEASHRGDELAASLHARRLARVGQGDTQRMLRVLDLQDVARALRHRAADSI